MKITVNGQHISIAPEVAPDMPLLWYVRDELRLTGTKFGCGIGQCGACTLHRNGRAVRSCSLPMSALDEGDTIVTIEGLAGGEQLHPVQRAWKECDVPQCGYCQSGQMMAAADLLSRDARPSDASIDRHQDNLCRCGTYDRIRRAIHRAAELTAMEQRAR